MEDRGQARVFLGDSLDRLALAGAEVGVETPLTDRLVHLVHDVEEGVRPQSWETLDALGG